MAKNPKKDNRINLDQSKTPRIAIRSSNDEKLSWRFAMLELVDPFGWHQLDKDKLMEVHSKLCEFEALTWNEVLVVRKKQNHSVLTDSICKEARDRLEELRQDDVDEIVSLRLAGAERVWGIREQSVLKLLWWDPKHKVYPTAK